LKRYQSQKDRKCKWIVLRACTNIISCYYTEVSISEVEEKELSNNILCISLYSLSYWSKFGLVQTNFTSYWTTICFSVKYYDVTILMEANFLQIELFGIRLYWRWFFFYQIVTTLLTLIVLLLYQHNSHTSIRCFLKEHTAKGMIKKINIRLTDKLLVTSFLKYSGIWYKNSYCTHDSVAIGYRLCMMTEYFGA
jgi:hypothetical protein